MNSQQYEQKRPNGCSYNTLGNMNDTAMLPTPGMNKRIVTPVFGGCGSQVSLGGCQDKTYCGGYFAVQDGYGNCSDNNCTPVYNQRQCNQ